MQALFGEGFNRLHPCLHVFECLLLFRSGLHGHSPQPLLQQTKVHTGRDHISTWNRKSGYTDQVN